MPRDSKRPQINMRLKPDEHGAFRRAAKAKGLDVSTWARQLLRAAAGLDSIVAPAQPETTGGGS